MKIETIDPRDRAEVVEVLSAAFAGHPLLPSDLSGRKSRLLCNALLDAFARAPGMRLFGIRRDDRLACVSFVFDASFEPRRFALMLLFFRMMRTLGWRMMRTFGEVLSNKIEGDERRLELMIIGTRSEFQRLGLGRAMMHHIFDYAREQEYESVVLEVAKETPAFDFYLDEGFQVEKEIQLPAMPLCMVRRIL